MINNLKGMGFKFLVIMTLFVVFVNIAHGQENDQVKELTPPPEIQKIFDRLKLNSPWNAGIITFVILDTNDIQAYMNGLGQVSVTKGMLNFLKQNPEKFDSMLAAIIAHEISHRTRYHTTLKSGQSFRVPASKNRNIEREADYYSIPLLVKSGYGCEGSSLSLRFVGYSFPYVFNSENDSHPHPIDRADQNESVCKYYMENGTLPDLLYYEAAQ